MTEVTWDTSLMEQHYSYGEMALRCVPSELIYFFQHDFLSLGTDETSHLGYNELSDKILA